MQVLPASRHLAAALPGDILSRPPPPGRTVEWRLQVAGCRGARRRVCWRSASSGTISRARSWVEASTTKAAAPSWWARSQLAAVTHQRSPGTSPGKRWRGIGVDRSLPIDRWCSRNSAVTTAQMVWLPKSSGPVEQQPSR